MHSAQCTHTHPHLVNLDDSCWGVLDNEYRMKCGACNGNMRWTHNILNATLLQVLFPSCVGFYEMHQDNISDRDGRNEIDKRKKKPSPMLSKEFTKVVSTPRGIIS